MPATMIMKSGIWLWDRYLLLPDFSKGVQQSRPCDFPAAKQWVLNLRQLIEHVTQPNISSSERLSVSLLYTLKARWACLEPETLRTRPRSPPHASTINSICTGKSGNQMRQAANSLGETYSRGLRGTHTCVGPARGLTKNHRSNLSDRRAATSPLPSSRSRLLLSHA